MARVENLPQRQAVVLRPFLSSSTREALVALGFLAPGLLLFVVFSLGPTIFSFVASFTNWSGLSWPQWVGLDNFTQLFADPLFQQALGNTTLYTVEFVVLVTVCSTLLAAALNRKMWGTSLVRLMWFLPIVTDMISISLVWTWLYNRQYGLINVVIGWVGLPPQSWLGDTQWALFSLVILSVWRWAGYYSIILLAALQGVPRELYEAARIDGAGRWRAFRGITVPLISPAIFFVVIISIVSSFQVFEQMWVMTQGGPEDSTISIAMYLYLQGFQYLNFGFASAVAWVLFMIIFIVTLINWKARSLWVYEA